MAADLSRRDFVGLTLTAALASGLKMNAAENPNTNIEYRTLGRTGEKVSALGLGGYHIGMQKDENESTKIIRAAIDSGINLLDNCWDYNDGTSEVRMGRA